MITCSICTIGDELLIGQVIDTNSATISKALSQMGISVHQKCTVGDNRSDILKAIDLILSNSDILILTGGLGPTKDDITKNVLAEYTGNMRFYRSIAQEAHIEEMCKKRGNSMFEINQTQADVPEGCSVLENRLGTAPGMWFEHQGKVIISLPGVAFEMEGLLPQVTERLKNRFSDSLVPIVHKTISTIGIPESLLAVQIAGWESELPHELHLAYLPNPLWGVRLRLSCYGDKEGADKIDKAFSRLKPLLGNALYGYGSETLSEVVAALLLQRNATLSTAESCTGGKIGSLITSLAGASCYYKGGVIAYDNKVKEEVLNVPSQIIEVYGAVSKQCVEAMAAGVRLLLHADYAIAVTGIAGPDGGSDEKPVGTVWIAVATPHTCSSQKFIFTGDRSRIMDRTSAAALNLIRIAILD